MAARRILLCGDVEGKFHQLFKRISSVSKVNGPFDALICVGQFFSNDPSEVDEVRQFVEGKQEIPLPTYFIGDYGETAAMVLSSSKLKAGQMGLTFEGIPVCQNLYWLKGSGVFNFQGLRVAYLGGKYVASEYQGAAKAQSHGVYHEDDVDALRAFADESDITDLFISNEWPLRVLDGVSKPSELDSSAVGNTIISDLAAELKPRYHIAGSEGLFYARDPYLNENASYVTRFVGLAAVGNIKKQKFLHALSLTPAVSMSHGELAQQPPNTTKSPYATSQIKGASKAHTVSKPSAPLHDMEGQYWRYATPQNKGQRTGDGGNEKICFEFALKGSCSRGDACNFKHERSGDKPLPKGACFDFFSKGKCSRGSECKFRHNLDEDKAHTDDPGAARSSAPCWFCLASPNVDIDLVIDVGEFWYCAMAKGGLIGGHVLLLPIEHVPSSLSLSETAVIELKRYKRALRNLYKSQGKIVVYFERCVQFKGGTHAHLQVVPVPLSKASQVRSTFVSAAKEVGFVLQAICPEEGDLGTQKALLSYLQGKKNYFFVELPEGTLLAHVLESGESVPIQFGREVCAKVLGVPERGDWRACTMSQDEEKAMADKFKEDFKAFK